MIQFLKLAGWLACVVYSSIPAFWLMIHPHADYWRSRRRSPYRILLPAWMGVWLLLGLLTFGRRRGELYSTEWTWVPAVVLFGIGFWLYVKAGASFSAAQLGGLTEVRPKEYGQQLMTTGIRARVRHPLYLGHLCEMVAWSLATGLAVCWGLTAFTIVTGAVMIRMEDRELEKRFGKEYAAYRERVPAVWPRVGGRVSWF